MDSKQLQRIERMLFDGTLDPDGGVLTTTGEPELGMTLRKADDEKYRGG
jgi:hypothetical protein